MTNQDLPPKIVREMYRCFTLDNLLENAHQPNDLISETVLIQYVGKWLQTNITLKQTIQYHGTAVPSREIYNTHGKIVWYLPQSNSFLVKGKSPQEYEEYSASQILHVLNYSTIASNFQAWLGESFWDFLMHHYRSFSKSKPDHEMELEVIIDKITPVMCDEISQTFFPVEAFHRELGTETKRDQLIQALASITEGLNSFSVDLYTEEQYPQNVNELLFDLQTNSEEFPFWLTLDIKQTATYQGILISWMQPNTSEPNAIILYVKELNCLIRTTEFTPFPHGFLITEYSTINSREIFDNNPLFHHLLAVVKTHLFARFVSKFYFMVFLTIWDEDQLKALLEANPVRAEDTVTQSAYSWLTRGQYLYDLEEDLEAAKWALQKTVDLCPTLADGWLSLGYVYVELGDIDGGIVLIKKAIEVAPERGAQWLGLGYIYDDYKHDSTLARDAYEKAKQLNLPPYLLEEVITRLAKISPDKPKKKRMKNKTKKQQAV